MGDGGAAELMVQGRDAHSRRTQQDSVLSRQRNFRGQAVQAV
jgi:hypothetical protein